MPHRPGQGSTLSQAGRGIGGLVHATPRGTIQRQTGRGPVKEYDQYPFVPWHVLEPKIVWRQGEHVLCVGGTGSGKTTLAARMLKRRSHVVVTVSKGTDPTFTREYRGYERIEAWPPPREYMQRVLLWPANKDTARETRENKKRVFRHMFDRVLLHEGGWCISVDEMHYMADTLNLEPEITDLEEQGRSAGISLWGNTQRPAGIGLAPYVNASHGFFYMTQEEYDVRRLASMAKRGTTAAELEANIRHLRRHEFVYVDRYGDIPPVRSKLEL
jgi:hypothetical protein